MSINTSLLPARVLTWHAEDPVSPGWVSHEPAIKGSAIFVSLPLRVCGSRWSHRYDAHHLESRDEGVQPRVNRELRLAAAIAASWKCILSSFFNARITAAFQSGLENKSLNLIFHYLDWKLIFCLSACKSLDIRSPWIVMWDACEMTLEWVWNVNVNNMLIVLSLLSHSFTPSPVSYTCMYVYECLLYCLYFISKCLSICMFIFLCTCVV